MRRARDAHLDVFKQAADEGRRLLEDQLSELDGMRGRSIQFLAFSGAAGAFLVGTSLKSAPTNLVIYFMLGGGASLLWIVALVLCMSVLIAPSNFWRTLWPTGSATLLEWDFRLNPRTISRMSYPVGDKEPTQADVFQKIAFTYTDMWSTNGKKLALVRRRYRIFIAVQAIQLALWIVLAWSNGVHGSNS